MKARFLTQLLVVVACILSAGASANDRGALTFNTLAEVFSNPAKTTKPAKVDVLRGTWAGGCFSSHDGDREMGAVLIGKRVPVYEGEQGEQVYGDSFTYYTSSKYTAKSFHNLTSKQVAKNADIAKWVEKEQWQKAILTDVGLTNSYVPSETVAFKRQVREYVDPFVRTFILKSTRVEDDAETVSTYCYFNKSLGNVVDEPTVPVTTGPTDYFITLTNETNIPIMFDFRFSKDHEFTESLARPFVLNELIGKNIQNGGPEIRYFDPIVKSWAKASVKNNARYILRPNAIGVGLFEIAR